MLILVSEILLPISNENPTLLKSTSKLSGTSVPVHGNGWLRNGLLYYEYITMYVCDISPRFVTSKHYTSKKTYNSEINSVSM